MPVTITVAIPARLQSTRFPRKVLALINGKSMLWHVYQRVMKAKSISDIYVLTDSSEVMDEVRSWGGKAIMTSEHCDSGTSRIASSINELKGDVIINVQGDEPLISAPVIDAVATDIIETDADISTPIYRITDVRDITRDTVVKVVRSANGYALYFSRSPIPYVRDVPSHQWLNTTEYWGHAGVYAFSRAILEEYQELPIGQLEITEKLEQLRFLELGKRIHTVEIDYHPIGVDVPEDLEMVRAMIEYDAST